MNKEEWSVLVEAFRILAPALTAYAVLLLRSLIKDINLVKAWQQAHDARDDERFRSIHTRLDLLEDK